MSIKKLAGQTAIYGVSSMVSRFLSYMLFPYFTYKMSTGEYGVITYLYAVIPFALVLLTMGLESGYFRFAGKARDEAEKREIFSTTWGFTSLLALLFALLTVLFCRPIESLINTVDNPNYIWMFGLVVMLDVVGVMPFARLREQGRPFRFMLVRVTSVVVNIAFCIFFISVLPELGKKSSFFASLYDDNFKPGYIMLANIIASTVSLLLLLPSCGGVVPRIDRKRLRTMMIYSAPLLVSGIAGISNELMDKPLLDILLPSEDVQSQLGIYGAVTKLGSIMLIFTQMYRYGAEPFFLSSFKGRDFEESNAVAMKYFIAVGILIFLGVAMFIDLWSLLISSEYRMGMGMLPALLISNLLAGVVFNLSFWYKQQEKTKYAIIITGTGFVFTVVFNILLVPLIGLWGAVLARLACELVMVGISYGLNQKHCPVPYDLRRIGEYVVLGGALYGLSVLAARLPEVLKYLCNLGLLGLYVLYFVRREKIDVAGLLRSIVRRRQ